MKILRWALYGLIKLIVAVIIVGSVVLFCWDDPEPASLRPGFDSVIRIIDDTTNINHSELPDSVRPVFIPAPDLYHVDSVEVNGVTVPIIYTKNNCQKILTVKRKVLFLFKVNQNERIFRRS